jgi:hypothetical protein
MRRALLLLARLYPRAWRERYGAEFNALMEDVPPDWREFTDVLGGAIKMQLTNQAAYLKLAAVMAMVGAVAAIGLSFASSNHYTSTAVLRMTPPHDPAIPGEYGSRQAEIQFEQMRQELLSRASLAEMIQRPQLDLYHDDRRRAPMEDIIQRMRRDIQIRPVAVSGDGPVTVEVSFTYPNRYKAQAVARELSGRFVEQNLAVNRYRGALWRNVWQETAPPGPIVAIVANATDPSSRGPNYLANVSAGVLAGALLGLLAVSFWRRPALAIRLAACAIAGFLLAGALSFYFLDSTYTSTAVMRFLGPLDPKRWYATQPHLTASEQLQQLEQQVLSTESLRELILRPSQDLYPEQRRRKPIDQVAAQMRANAIRIEILPAQLSPGPSGDIRISFTYTEPFKTQAIVRELVTKFNEANFTRGRQIAVTAGGEIQKMEEHKIGENLEVLDPASLPQAPDGPNRLAIAGAGLVAGLLLGIALHWRKPGDRSVPNPAAAARPA